MKTADQNESPLRIVEATVQINEARKHAKIRKVITAMNGDVHYKTVTIPGLTFKPHTDSMRAAPSIAIFQASQDVGAKVKAYDPEGVEHTAKLMSDVEFARSAYDAAEALTHWLS